jgi:hypothetical protein
MRRKHDSPTIESLGIEIVRRSYGLKLANDALAFLGPSFLRPGLGRLQASGSSAVR